MNNGQLTAGNDRPKPGYKQTEVGVIPEDWEIATAEQVCELVVDCKNRTPPFVDSSEFAVVRTPNVRNGRFVYEELRFTDEKSFHEWTARAVPKAGDILITREAPLGEVCLVPTELKFCLGQRMMLYRPDLTKADNIFFLYSLMATAVQSCLLKKIGGSTVGHAKVNDIRTLEVPLPPLPEQRSIAQALSDVDALIAALDKAIAKKRHLKTATMQQLLTGKKRLPGFGERKGYQQTEVGLTPEDWSVLKLRDVIKSFQNGYAFSAQGYVLSGVPIITMAQIGLDGTFQFSEGSVNYWSVEDFNKLKPYYVEDGDVIIAMTDVTPEKNLIGRMTIVCSEQITLLNQRVGLLKLDLEKVNPLFLTAVSNQRRWREYSRSVASLGVQANIGTKDIKDGLLVLPSVEEQRTIAAVLSDMDTEIAALETRLAKTQALKQGMMQALLTGRVRLV